MPTLHLSTPGLRVRLEGERLLIAPPAEGTAPAPPDQPVHLRDIERVFVGERTAVSLASLAELVRRGAPVVVLDARGELLGFFQRPAPPRTAARAQYERSRDAAFGIAVAVALVEAKILNQRRVLQRLAANRDEAEITPALLRMSRIAESALAARSLETLRGYEGTAAGLHFETYATFFPPDVPFERRSRRPPHNPPNAILSYCYTLLAAECEAILHTLGLDPAVGFYHEPGENRPALALDLIEPFRAPVADAMALDLLTHGTLHPRHHFETRDAGCYLNAEGKRRFFVAYERRMEREFTSTHAARRTTLRRELELQARALRDTVCHDTMFEPFRMN